MCTVVRPSRSSSSNGCFRFFLFCFCFCFINWFAIKSATLKEPLSPTPDYDRWFIYVRARPHTSAGRFVYIVCTYVCTLCLWRCVSRFLCCFRMIKRVSHSLTHKIYEIIYWTPTHRLPFLVTRRQMKNLFFWTKKMNWIESNRLKLEFKRFR